MNIQNTAGTYSVDKAQRATQPIGKFTSQLLENQPGAVTSFQMAALSMLMCGYVKMLL